MFSRGTRVLGAGVFALALTLTAPAFAHSNSPKPKPPQATRIQQSFDPIGPQIRKLTMDNGREVSYLDEGDRRAKPYVFIGGQGTSLQAFQLNEMYRTTRQNLRLRAISVERNGFGESPYDPSLGYEDYVNEVLAVLDHLGVKKFAIQAVSGGGAYATHLAARVPERVTSLHLSSTVTWALPGTPLPASCSLTMEERNAANVRYTHNPKLWWAMPETSPVKRIPGWQDEAYLDAARSFFINGQLGDPNALSHEGQLPCLPGAKADVSRVWAPAYLYGGDQDTAVPIANVDLWADALPNVAAKRIYPGEGHDVQYRHGDQILVDLAGLGRSTVMCVKGSSVLLSGRAADRALKAGATLGICAWRDSSGYGTR